TRPPGARTHPERSRDRPGRCLHGCRRRAAGTARWQKEAAEKTEQKRILAEVEHKRSEVALARAELTARIEALEQELKQKEAEAERLNGAEARRKLDLVHRREGLEHSPSAKIFKKRPDNYQGAGQR